jgi:hypothetical protein
MKEALIILLVVITTNVSWLLKILINFPVYYVNYLVLPLLLFTSSLSPKAKLHKEDFLIVLFLLLSAISVVKTAIYDGQSIVSGIKVAKFDFLILFYFVARNAVLDVAKINKSILIFGFLISLVIIYASISQNELFFQVAHISSRKTRYGIARYVLGLPIIGYCCIYSFVRFMRSQKIVSAFLCGYFFIIMVLFMQTRSIIFASILVLAMIYVGYAGKNILISLSLALVFLGLVTWQAYSENSLARRYIETSQAEMQEANKEINSISSRQSSHRYFFNEYLKHPIVGIGKFWSDSSTIEERRKLNRPIFETDVGLAGVLYKHGLIGATWLIGFYYLVLFKFRKNVQFKAVDHYFYFFVFCLLSGITIDYFTDSKNEVFTFLIFGLYSRCFREAGAVEITS